MKTNTPISQARKVIQPSSDAAALVPASLNIHCSTSNTAAIPAVYSVKYARRVRGTMPREASLRVIFTQRDKSSRLYPDSTAMRGKRFYSEPCQKFLLEIIAVSQPQRAGCGFETTVSAESVDAEKVAEAGETRGKLQKKSRRQKQPHPKLKQGQHGVQPEFGGSLHQFLGQ